MTTGTLTRVVGALAEATGLRGIALHELVRVGHRRLLGEVLRITGDDATVQVFEETTGLRVGEPVVPDEHPLSIELGPGLLGQVIDGIGRLLARLGSAGAPSSSPARLRRPWIAARGSGSRHAAPPEIVSSLAISSGWCPTGAASRSGSWCRRSVAGRSWPSNPATTR